MHTLQEHHDELMNELVGRLRRAELALNRHGFRDDGKEWHAPPAWSTMVELRKALATAEMKLAIKDAQMEAQQDELDSLRERFSK